MQARKCSPRQMCTICPPAARGRPPCSPPMRSSPPYWPSGRYCFPRCCLLVIDGYADLDPAGRPGLGAHAHAAFGVPVIGVAKTRFRTATHAVEVLRGRSARPLFVTAAGIPTAQAASLVRKMAGPFRLPDALRRADALARTRHDHTTAARPEAR
jgi:deoxyinosine 3'endonuclease (endonuclease V)